MTTVGVAIIGAGQIALANHLPGLKLLPNAKLIALCDSDENTLRRASDQTGIKATFTDYNKLLEHDGVDAVVIATPNITHPPIAIAAAKAGKHVMCEKRCSIGSANAAVLPVPVWAQPMTSSPASANGITALWIGVVRSNPRSSSAWRSVA